MSSTCQIENSSGYLKIAVLASLSLHLFFVCLFWKSLRSVTLPPAELIFSAELVPSLPAPRAQVEKPLPSQIVAPLISSTEQPVEAKRVFESDQDNASLKEQIRRGDEGNSLHEQNNPDPKNSQAASLSRQKTASETKPQKNAEKTVKDTETAKADDKPKKLKLQLANSTIAELTAADMKKSEQQSAQEKLEQAIQSGANDNQKSSINVSRLGSRDYLPDIPDGEVTLLNTKANKFAVFVRRVASQVFANLRGAGWRNLSAADIRAINKEGVFEAVLSPKGNLISVKLASPSESNRFDQVLKSAIESGAKDPNPPAGAEAEDGNIHFIFQAKSWVQIQPSARNGAPVERRWLVLGTGLE